MPGGPLRSRIGKMRERLTLQHNLLQTSTGGDGFKSHDWTPYATGVPAEYLEPPSGVETWEATSVTAELVIMFRVRYRADVQPKHRVIWRGQVLEIYAVIPIQSVGDRFLRLQCSLSQ